MTTGVAPVTSLEEGGECGLGTLQVVAHHGHPLNDPFLVEVIQHFVLRASIIPHGDGAGLPTVAQSELFTTDPACEVGEQVITFLSAEFNDASREVLIDEQGFVTGNRVLADDGMYRHYLWATVGLGVVKGG